jgi:hypothetical protein
VALCGVASPILLTTTTLIVAYGRPEYSHFKQTLSELGAVGRPGADAMNLLGIVPTGILVALSALPLYRGFGGGKLGAAGAVALALGGLCLAGTALTPWRGGTPANVGPVTGNVVHLALAIVGFFGLALSPFFFGLRARRVSDAGSWTAPSLAAAALIAGLAFWQAPGDYAGAFQRGALGVFFLWLAAASVWVWRDR